ncbi:hypothetical protein [[Flexibacter] sp. ATCC 35208]|uniref:hypothetical protein n=1 Tax=[Flexibacter] sp. ATCC 35208 TaxID=1936242 RepID=UPI00117CA4EA|nr:hypothetical protein [[Flexibacter] sp. ATCC 35208]
MKNTIIAILFLTVTGAVLLWSACKDNSKKPAVLSQNKTAYSTIQLPQDALSTCTIPQDTFNTWFLTGKATENGHVTPANSITFGHQNNCDFYQWSERMFLWVTSPNTGEYGSTGRVLESPVFYTVAPDTSGGMTLIKHLPGTILPVVPALKKNGPNRLPLFSDRKGHLFEVWFHKAGEKVLVKNSSGKIIELGPVGKDAKGIILLKDKQGVAIEKPQFVTKLTNPKNVIHAFATSNGNVFFDMNGNQVETELAQATQDALMAQNGSLVYYITFVNDMYAYFLAAVQAKYMSGYQFPTTLSGRDSIMAYAKQQGYSLPPDSNALAIELKTSWIIADSLSDASGFVTIDAIIPTYNTSSPSEWPVTGQQQVKLALVGMHVVGSVAGHPEMIWATFEHNSNTPNASYQYIDSNKIVQTVPADKGNWLFNSNTSLPADSFNNPHMTADSVNTLFAEAPYTTISASNTLRLFPFGAAFNLVPNQQDTSASASNTEVISINNNIMGMIPGNDIRKNYVFIGATWTNSGTAPNGNVYSSDPSKGSAIGTSLLANSTMETYLQGTAFSCFTCHNNNNSLAPGALSHIFDSINPVKNILKKMK